MLAAVLVWTLASVSHAWVSASSGLPSARAVLGFGEGGAFPGVMRTATDALPPNRQARGIALGYSGASLGAIVTPLVVTPIALKFGWRSAFLVTGGLGACWLVLWYFVAQPPFLPAVRHSPPKFIWPNLLERRAWVVISSFGLGGVALGVVGYLSPLYLSQVMNLSQADLGKVVWIPLVGWEIGYFFWGWIGDRYMSDEKTGVKRSAILFGLMSYACAAFAFDDADSLSASCPGTLLLGDFRRRRFRGALFACRFADLSEGSIGDGGGHWVRSVVVGLWSRSCRSTGD